MRLKKITALIILLCLLVSFAGSGFARGMKNTANTSNTANSLQDALAGIAGYYKANQTNLETWRQVVGLKEAGEDLAASPWVLPDWKLEQLNGASQPTDYAGTILGMMAAGADPEDVEGRNLVEELAARQNENGSFGSGLNQTIWAMNALDKAGGSYDINTTGTATGFLLGQQKADGSFAFMGDTGDPDTTGMALVALAPHAAVAGVTAAIERAVQCLKNLQLPGGGFASGGAESPESVAAVIQGLLACGERGIASGDWQKPEGNMIDALFAFQLEDGSFIHSTAETGYNVMATEQALLAAAAMVNAGIDYTVKTGKKHIADEKVEAAVRVRVEGAKESLADETVTVAGTAMDALLAAVGEENVTAPGGFVTGILGEGGKDLPEDIRTDWMYYVVRDGAIEPGAFSQGAGSYNVCSGDEVIFYIGAIDSAWAPKTFFPEVSIAPATPRAGDQVTLIVKTLKTDWMAGCLVELTAEELADIGEYTVVIADKEDKTRSGRFSFTAAKAGTLPFTVINQNEKGYPNAVPYRGSISVGAPSGSGGDPSAPTCSPGVAVVGRNGEKLFGPATVSVLSSNPWGQTALGALEATGVSYVISSSFDGYVDSIAGQVCEGLEGWMFTVNGTVSMVSARDYNISSGDKVIWYFSKSIDQEAPTWAQLISGDMSASPLPTTFVTSTTGGAFVSPAAGGNIGLGAAVSVNIPAGALFGTAGVDIAIHKAGDPPVAPAGCKLCGSVFEFTVGGSSGYNFNKPVTLTFGFDPDVLPEGVTPSVYYFDETTLEWVELGGAVSGNTITVEIDHFTRFAIFIKEGAPTQISAQAFADVQGSFWASEAINELYSLGYINGYPDGTFRPDNRITRAEFVSILDRMLDLANSSSAVPDFRDVTSADWFYAAVRRTAYAGIIKGCGNNLFNPNKEITREELAAMTVNVLAGHGEAGVNMNGKTGFTDDSSISRWARAFVAAAAKAGLITGFPDNSFRPQSSATRAEACAIITKLLNLTEWGKRPPASPAGYE